MHEVEISSVSPERFRALLTPDMLTAFDQGAREGLELLTGRVVWNVNSTARGGGVVELLTPLLSYARGIGIDARWLVMEGSPEFFAVTKRLHNRLHGSPGDGLPLDARARDVFERAAAQAVANFAERLQPGDVVIVHDPQPAGLIEHAIAAGAAVIWRCHVGIDKPNASAREAWSFLLPYVRPADAYVFSRFSYAWEGLDRDRSTVIAPSIDVLSPKNVELDERRVRAVLRAAGLVADGPSRGATFTRHDGTPGRVERRAELYEDERLRLGTPIVLQVSRWDSLKDPHGVIRGFAEHVPASTGAHLVYAGPSVASVADDPEGEAVLREAIELREGLPPEVRARVHLASLPMEDADENAIIVNALQRYAGIVVQKSLAEGFGLTVAEAMWKAKPVVASRIGGLQDQIVDGESGVLLDDPHDLRAFGDAVTGLLIDSARAERIGRAAQERVRGQFVSARSLLDYLAITRRVLDATARRRDALDA